MALKAPKKQGMSELEKVTAEIEQEEMRQPNLDAPVVDEDGVVRDVPLLAGYIDPKTGVLHDTFSYREMNGADEEAINKADVRANAGKLANVLCERCVIAIGTLEKKEHRAEWGKIIRSMLGGDIDYMMFKVRELSKGKDVTFKHVCHHCGQALTTVMSTDEFGIKPFKGEREVSFELLRGYKDVKGRVYKEGVARLVNGYDREVIVPVVKKNPSTAMTMFMTRCVTFDNGKVQPLQSQVKEMVLRDRDIIQKIFKENAFGIDTTIEGLVCDNCGQDISGELGQTDFF